MLADDTGAVLGVTRSAGHRRWIWRDPRLAEADNRLALALAQQAGIPELLARILSARGVAPHDASSFLNPRLRDAMPDPSCLQDMDRAAERLAQAVRNHEHVGLFGDYDVDGACGTTLVCDTLRELGCTVSTHIPDRLTEGYGPNAAALENLLSQGATLLVCIDCGTAAIDILNGLSDRADIIVLDHHKPDGAALPKGIVVNPNRLDCTSGLGSICATAVAFLTMVATIRHLRRTNWFDEGQAIPDLLKRLDLTALATICDVMPLTGLNRALVMQGLRVMSRGERLGLATLSSVAGVKEEASAMACGFALGPRINAGGRIAQADLGLKLLLSDDVVEARALAEQLDRVNRQRQTVESTILDSAMEQAQQQLDAGHAVIFLHGETWHPGVVGIVAGRLKERYNRPALVAALTDGVIKGSARSVSGLDLGTAIIAARQNGLLLSGGGHAMAAGFSLSADRADEFHSWLDTQLSGALALPKQDALKLDGIMTLAGASIAVADQLARLEPFGPGNEEPVLAISNVRCVKSERIGKDGNTLRVILQGEDGGTRLRGLVFRAADKPFAALLEDRSMPLVHVAGTLRAETWQERKNLSFFISDAAPA
ncbi:MAG: single-stranded-DNA-specific exonuclease RecJ [Gluconobacter potus]|uniref:Single-stranded-DNA-specific exonuclease RecJ n=1 Tax=Gluconobacter potus TaxID=2724927 RepID=A0ABR9YJT0_9PROT|nr:MULTISPECIES: single-stranded-DNA-specific exonuclease RecJ [Gluconobacter]MBF0864225.1 single-stranded-DNA-specific exonuclease RecJ [Gluconobacter sp. R71656]MBF0867893.1 single-stranded-DNA-specific exonuclease RecJ [Gluconobacter sp. R75628]MBF0872818.1 single-stranded-DNA-specific exonuclease RecJ [Gluconobacter sp. R75629]MBF0882064.1 single-stranded-DNA-specific exonuclease RecJ [Gluconobacter potus]